MSVTDELLENARRYREGFDAEGMSAAPTRHVTIVACMDARLDMFGLLGLEIGDAHIIRNAGGVVTPDVIRSVSISQRMLGTREIVLIHHTSCGMQGITDDGFREQLFADTGLRPDWAVESFTDVDEDVRQSIARITANPFVPHKDSVRGFVFDVESGELREVTV
ncbi:beta-class carbonic anhydrase [Actinoallomurus rhizosphaericola]|uniref:beta-class carbonic anhydrase n=1 Tax=Actinoallomurus rhizosphaericola TaxID=2952536 RepID=UPI0020927E3E|nr:carbonic anhydrase [Actinoallomurus rhizosphaericola]MCO5999175.1 carbonic anhydrase [Actinoallomurus rhizosphaericola]